ncbi:serine hydrolase [Candidatus Saccharibacteria bacterium]|nr:serine hydrolase [Candidatus Saccharibacteria bacterium]
MTLVMDGVRRTGLVSSPIVKPVRRTPPILEMVPRAAYRTGLDGIRRNVPSPREMLAVMQTSELADIAPAVAPAMHDWQRLRQAATFSLVATTLTAVGVVTAASAVHTTATALAPATARAAHVIAPGAAASTAPAVAPSPVDTGLQALLTSFAGGSSMYGISVTNLSTGETASVNGAAPMEAASLYKLFVASEIYHRIDIGQLTYGQDAGGGSGQNIADCLNAMITVSDNTCGHALGDIVGWGDLNAGLKAEGYTATDLSGAYPTSSPQDIAKLYSRLYGNTLNSPSSNAAFIDLLKNQSLNAQLPSGLPAGTVIAHKTGELDGYIHDAGIVYGPKANYIVVMLSGPWGTPAAANSAFTSLSGQLWNHIEQ